MMKQFYSQSETSITISITFTISITVSNTEDYREISNHNE